MAKKETRIKKEKDSKGAPRENQLRLMEDYLIRSITKQEFHPDVLAGDWGLLTNWQEGRNCRMFWEVVMSHALDLNSKFFAQAHEIIAEQSDKRFATAVALYRARHSVWSRRDVFNYYIDQYGFTRVLPSQEVLSFFDSLNSLGRSKKSWQEICQTLELKNWDATPPEHQIELWDACRRLLNNPCSEDLVAMADELTELPHFHQMPRLKRRIVDLSLWPRREHIYDLVSNRYDTFADAIIDLLINFDLPEQMFHDRQPRELKYCRNRLKTYAQFIKEHLSQLPPETKATLLISFSPAAKYYWNWGLITAILKSQHGLPARVELIYGTLKAMLQNPLLSQDADSKNPVRFAAGPETKQKHIIYLIEIIKTLSAKEAIELFALILADQEADYDKKQLFSNYPRLIPSIEQMRAESDYAQEMLGEYVEKGMVDADFVVHYYQALGIEQTRYAILIWISLNGINSGCSPIIEEIVIPNKLPAGELVRTYARDLFLQGYELQLEDLKKAKPINRLLWTETNSGRTLSPIWDVKNPWQWAEVLLRSQIGLGAIVSSMLDNLLQMNGSEFRTFIDKILLPACQENQDLVNALGVRAWTPNPEQYPGKLKFLRLFTAQHPSFSRWIKGIGETYYIPCFLKSHWHRFLIKERETANLLFNPKKQVDIFFANAAEDGTDHFSTFHPRDFIFFDGDSERKRLRDWLFAKWPQLNPVAWMNWIEEFDFVGDKRLPHIIRKFLESANPQIAAKAAAIRQKIWDSGEKPISK